MVSEQAARQLIAEAADTVPVAPRSGRAVLAAAQRRSRRLRIAVAAGVATATVVAGGAVVAVGSLGQRPADTPPPVASPTPSPPASSSAAPRPSGGPGRRVGVPILVEYPRAEALRRVAQWGLTARVVSTLRACHPAGWVVEQRPAVTGVRRVPVGSTVTLLVATPESEANCPRGAAFDHHRAIAASFYDFSRGVPGATLPVDTPVELGLGDGPRVTLSAVEAGHLDRWRVDPANVPGSGTVALLQPLAASRGRYQVNVDRPPECSSGATASPREFGGSRFLTISPMSGGGSCAWALDVYLNDVGQVVGVILDQHPTAG